MPLIASRAGGSASGFGGLRTFVPAVTTSPDGSYDALQSVALTGSTATITFTGIPQHYKHLQIRAVARDEGARTFGSFLRFNFNDETNNRHRYHRLAGRADGVTYAQTGFTTYNEVGTTAGNNGVNFTYAVNIIDILDYSDAEKYTTLRAFSLLLGQSTTTDNDINLFSGLFQNSAAIQTITITASAGFMNGSSFDLYGIK